MKVIIFLNSLFLKPSTYMIALYVYIKMIRIYKNEIKSKIGNSSLSEWDLFGKANMKISQDNESVVLYCELIREQLGIFKYIISLLFWVAIYNFIF